MNIGLSGDLEKVTPKVTKVTKSHFQAGYHGKVGDGRLAWSAAGLLPLRPVTARRLRLRLASRRRGEEEDQRPPAGPRVATVRDRVEDDADRESAGERLLSVGFSGSIAAVFHEVSGWWQEIKGQRSERR